MLANVGWFERRNALRWLSVVIALGSLTWSSAARASNPWGRAVGEAHGVQHVTEDLRNRAHRLYAGSPVTALTCAMDDAAIRLVELVKCGADWGALQIELRGFEHLKSHLAHLVPLDCHMNRDRTIAHYLRMIEDRFGDLVRDLSKCKIPVPGHQHPHFHTDLLIPHSYSDFAPPAYAPPPPVVVPRAPEYWQGSVPRETTPADRPVSSEILAMLISRALRK